MVLRAKRLALSAFEPNAASSRRARGTLESGWRTRGLVRAGRAVAGPHGHRMERVAACRAERLHPRADSSRLACQRYTRSKFLTAFRPPRRLANCHEGCRKSLQGSSAYRLRWLCPFLKAKEGFVLELYPNGVCDPVQSLRIWHRNALELPFWKNAGDHP
jgi:hypothetical protein